MSDEREPYESPRLRRLDELTESILQQWGRDYGGSKYEHVGYPSISTISTLIDHHGFRPDSQLAKLCIRLDSVSDGVESIVMKLQAQGIDGDAEAHCLRVCYDPFTPIEKARITRLNEIGRRIGNPILARIGKHGYYKRLASARGFIANELAMVKRASGLRG